MKRMLTAMLMACAFYAAYGDGTNEIEGAFGEKFGNPCTNTLRASVASPDEWIFTPQVPNVAFNEYRVFITPRTHVVYKIMGIKALRANEHMEDAEFYALREMIWKKYGKRGDDVISEPGDSGARSEGLLIINRNNRFLVLNQKGVGSGPMIVYWDKRLAELAKKERAEIEGDANKTEPSGL
jgi:hypothetical protein